MRRLISICVLIVLVFNGLFAQNSGTIPFNPQSPIFGKDVIIRNDTSKDERAVAICSAFNGWLFSVFSYTIPNLWWRIPEYSIMKSIDHGMTWTLFTATISPMSYYVDHSFSIIASGNSLSDLKIIVSWVAAETLGAGGNGICYRYNGQTGDYIDCLLEKGDIKSIALTSDYPHPATNSNPSSLGLLYSKTGYGFNQDSLIFLASDDGGNTFSNSISIPLTMKRAGNVAISYGRSSNYPTGRYFAVWEEHSDNDLILGHIYTAHTEPYFNSHFSVPVNLDSLDFKAINKCKNPTIACQNSISDNGQGNFTEIILFEKVNTQINKTTISGYYNLESATTNHFSPFYLPDSSNFNQQPTLIFNYFDSTFLESHFDLTLGKLPLFRIDYRLIDPNNWSTLSQGINDDSNLLNPIPKLAIDDLQMKTLCVWNAEDPDGKGVSMFDSELSTFTNINDSNSSKGLVCEVFPNPCSNNVHIAFKYSPSGNFTLTVSDITGTIIKKRHVNSSHDNAIEFDTSDLHDGVYILTISNAGHQINKKIIVNQ